jgi:hypothetical protein
MGLWRGKVQSIFMGFYILPRADGREESTYHEKRYIQKEEKRIETKTMGKQLSRSTAHLVLDSGAYVIKEDKNHYVRIISKNIARYSIWNRYVYIFEPIPEIFWL